MLSIAYREGGWLWTSQVPLHLERLHRGWPPVQWGVVGEPVAAGMQELPLDTRTSCAFSLTALGCLLGMDMAGFFSCQTPPTLLGQQCLSALTSIVSFSLLSIAAEPLFRLRAEPWVMQLPQVEGLGPQGLHVAHLKTSTFPSLLIFLPGKNRPWEIRKSIKWKK